jgi:hypothetical protein
LRFQGRSSNAMSSRGEGGGDDKADNDSARRDDDGTQKPMQRHCESGRCYYEEAMPSIPSYVVTSLNTNVVTDVYVLCSYLDTVFVYLPRR